MGSISKFQRAIDQESTTMLLSILSRLAMMGSHGLAADRILAIAGHRYYNYETPKCDRKFSQKRTSSSGRKFLADLCETGFAEELEGVQYSQRDLPKFIITEQGRLKLAELKADFDRQLR